jgi:hypothetical protein
MVLVQKEIFMVSVTYLVFILGVGVNTVYLSIDTNDFEEEKEEKKVTKYGIGCFTLLLSSVLLIIFFNRLIPFLQHYEDFEEDDIHSMYTIEERFTVLEETG